LVSAEFSNSPTDAPSINQTKAVSIEEPDQSVETAGTEEVEVAANSTAAPTAAPLINETEAEDNSDCTQDGWPCSGKGACFNSCCSGQLGEGKGWFRCPGTHRRFCGDFDVYVSTHC
jgi:hypothetical protein